MLHDGKYTFVKILITSRIINTDTNLKNLTINYYGLFTLDSSQ